MGKNNQSGFHLVVTLLALAVLGVAGFVGYKVYKKDPKYQAPAASSKASTTESTTESTTKSSEPSVVAPSAAELENIEASITSGNTAALEGYMAASVNVILAASEAYGPQTPAQAVSDVDYVSDGSDPWNFALPAATLAQYQTGDYKQYFPVSALVGKSANGYVVSFQFDNAGKIDGIFMTNNADIL